MTMQRLISVVVPVYRNASTLEALHTQLDAALTAFRCEFLFVNDAGPDHSLDILRGLAGRDARVGVIALSHNIGQNGAVLVGLRHAVGQVAVVLDADLQDPPAAIPALIEALARRRAACVFAGRRGQYATWKRSLTSRFFKVALHVLSGFRLPVDAGLFLAMDRRMIDILVAHDRQPVYILSLIARSGLPLASIPVLRLPGSDTNYTFRMRLKLALRAARTLWGWYDTTAAVPPALELIGSKFQGENAE